MARGPRSLLCNRRFAPPIHMNMMPPAPLHHPSSYRLCVCSYPYLFWFLTPQKIARKKQFFFHEIPRNEAKIEAEREGRRRVRNLAGRSGRVMLVGELAARSSGRGAGGMALRGGAAAGGVEDAVVMQLPASQGEDTVITVNCPDQAGLGCDLCRTILEFGLRITRGDVSTDGKWCYVVFWVVPCSLSINIRWENLKNRLMSMCPSSYAIPFYPDITQPGPSQFYLLKLFSADRKGLLHDVTHILSELELIIHRVKVSTTPDGRVVDLFFITDGMELLHTKERQEETYAMLIATLGPSVSCEILLAEGFQQGFSSLPPAISEELFRLELADSEICSRSLSAEMKKMQKATINFDNSLSPAHTLLQIICVDQKGLIYDIFRTLKDCSIQVTYGRFWSDKKGFREVDLFIKQADGKKVIDPEKQDVLRSRLRSEMLHPLRVMIVSRGPDTELLVANPVELSRKGRPRVFYDATFALKELGICIFSAEIGRQEASERQWEVYRFLLDDSKESPLSNSLTNRNRVVDRVRRTLMGCFN